MTYIRDRENSPGVGIWRLQHIAPSTDTYFRPVRAFYLYDTTGNVLYMGLSLSSV